MGEGHWIEVRVVPGDGVDTGKCVKSLRQLRKELAGEGVPTQDVARTDVAIAVALVGPPETVVDVLRDWSHRRKSPASVVITMGDDSIELQRQTFGEQAEELKAFLSRHQGV